MNYKFIEKKNFEDLSSGRVIYGKAGFTNFSTRLTCEIFMRCLESLGITGLGIADKKATVYDPCCGGGYLLTVLGFVFNDKLEAIYGSDISDEAIILANKNLELLKHDGLIKRKEQLSQMYDLYKKESHLMAVKSAENLLQLIGNTISNKIFKRDILNPAGENTLAKKGTLADIIITDIPYGNLASWSGDGDDSFAADNMLNNILDDLSDNAVVAVSTDKRQKINSPYYKRIEKLQIGKRKVELLKRRD